MGILVPSSSYKHFPVQHRQRPLATSFCHLQFAGEHLDSADAEPAAMKVKNRREALKLPPIDQKVLTQLSVGKSNQTFPQTTSKVIGWRSSEEQCKLERYGRYTKKNQSFLKSMKWPMESII